MVQIGRRGTARRLFENFKKNSQKSQNSSFKILVHHFLRLCLLCIVKNATRFEQNWRRRYILKSAAIAIMQVWTRHPRPMLCARRHTACLLQSPIRCGVPVAQRTTPFAARYDIRALQRGTFKNSTLGVFINSEWIVFGNSGSGHVQNSELGTTFDGHSELGAFGPGGAIGP